MMRRRTWRDSLFDYFSAELLSVFVWLNLELPLNTFCTRFVCFASLNRHFCLRFRPEAVWPLSRIHLSRHHHRHRRHYYRTSNPRPTNRWHFVHLFWHFSSSRKPMTTIVSTNLIFWLSNDVVRLRSTHSNHCHCPCTMNKMMAMNRDALKMIASIGATQKIPFRDCHFSLCCYYCWQFDDRTQLLRFSFEDQQIE